MDCTHFTVNIKYTIHSLGSGAVSFDKRRVMLNLNGKNVIVVEFKIAQLCERELPFVETMIPENEHRFTAC